jgi:hypothetical protein
MANGGTDPIFLINDTWKCGQIHASAALPTGTEPLVSLG